MSDVVIHRDWMERDSFVACSLCRDTAINCLAMTKGDCRAMLAMTSRKGLAMMNKKMVRSDVYKKTGAMVNRPCFCGVYKITYYQGSLYFKR